MTTLRMVIIDLKEYLSLSNTVFYELLEMLELVGISDYPYFYNVLLCYGDGHYREGMTIYA